MMTQRPRESRLLRLVPGATVIVLTASVLALVAAGLLSRRGAGGRGDEATSDLEFGRERGERVYRGDEPGEASPRIGLRIVDEHFLELNGNAVSLFGTANFWTLADTGVDFIDMIDSYAEAGANLMRMSIMGPPVSKRSHLEARGVIYPVARAGPGRAADGGSKFDVQLLNPRFFARLDSVVAHARSLDVVIILLLWDEIPLERGSARWRINPYNPDNNVNNLGLPTGDAVPEFYDLTNVPLLESQERVVRRVLQVVRPHGNVIIGISNEYTGPPEWHRHWHDYVQLFESLHPGPPLLTIELEWHGFRPDYTDLISGSTHRSGGAENWQVDPPRPVVNYTSRAQWDDDADEARRIFWRTFVNGGHTTDDAHDGDKPADYHNSRKMKAARFELAIMRQLLNRLPINDMYPEAALARDLCSVECRARLASHYVAYLPDGGAARVDLRDSYGELRYEWLDPETGERTRPQHVETGEIRDFVSPFSEAVLYIYP